MSRNTKRPITTGTYTSATPDGWAGWVEDKESTWILYFKEDGSALFYARREKTGDHKGGVLGEGVPSQPMEK